GVLFSSDLFIRRGGLKESVIKANWAEEVKKIAMEQIPNPTALEKLQETLLLQPVHFVAPGHGPFMQTTV
ncbi:MAG TPA: MBL fold metallo-hydrolase, partial [Bacillota bacterium]|nr:MBL fold metallo-hydrolase [Bacillota bacterium]